jgi:hypothetical protein
LTFRQNTKFYTIPGVLISIIVLIGVLSYGIFTSLGLWNKSLDHLSVLNTERVLTGNPEDLYFDELEKQEYNPKVPFAFGFKDRTNGKGVKLDKTYG